MKECCECRDSEHDNIDNDVQLTTIKDPNTNKLIKRGYLCAAHREIYQDDGYSLYRGP